MVGPQKLKLELQCDASSEPNLGYLSNESEIMRVRHLDCQVHHGTIHNSQEMKTA